MMMQSGLFSQNGMGGIGFVNLGEKERFTFLVHLCHNIVD